MTTGKIIQIKKCKIVVNRLRTTEKIHVGNKHIDIIYIRNIEREKRIKIKFLKVRYNI